MQINTTLEDHRIAKLAAFAICLHVLEAAFPSPLPGVKPGIANIVVLFVFYEYGLKTAVWVSLLRVFASGLLLGQFLSPTFFLSLSGAVVSLVVLSLAQYLPRRFFSAATLSMLAAFGHIAGQLCLVRIWLIPDESIWALAPIFALAALFFGLINGLIVQRLLEQVQQH